MDTATTADLLTYLTIAYVVGAVAFYGLVTGLPLRGSWVGTQVDEHTRRQRLATYAAFWPLFIIATAATLTIPAFDRWITRRAERNY